MRDSFRLMAVQDSWVAGDLAGNAARALAHWRAGREAGVDLVALGEMGLTGWPLHDLALRTAFVDEVAATLGSLAAQCADGPALALGAPLREGGAICNGWCVLVGGEVRARVLAHHAAGRAPLAPAHVNGPLMVAGLRIGVLLGDDIDASDVAETLAETGAEILIAPSAMAHARGDGDRRINRLVARVVETDMPLVWINSLGGAEGPVHDGGSMVLNPGGALAVQLPALEPVAATVTFRRGARGWCADAGERAVPPSEAEADYRACVVALADYAAASGIERVLLGLSGGIDSALVATIAADALGPGRLRCVMLPSEFTSAASGEDAASLARTLGCRLDEVPINPLRLAVGESVAPVIGGAPAGLVAENIQARLRGLVLMTLSNHFGEMLLATGNKSESAVGYATLYGDTNGGFAPIADLYKTRVYECARWRNANHRAWMKGPAGPVIPQRILGRAPSAELRPDQRDEDSLPPYDILDPILEGLVERRASVADLVAAGFERATVERVERLLAGAEYKRFQEAPGPWLTRAPFGAGWRQPLVTPWRDTSGREHSGR